MNMCSGCTKTPKWGLGLWCIVCFVYIGEIVAYHCLNFLFITLDEILYIMSIPQGFRTLSTSYTCTLNGYMYLFLYHDNICKYLYMYNTFESVFCCFFAGRFEYISRITCLLLENITFHPNKRQLSAALHEQPFVSIDRWYAVEWNFVGRYRYHICSICTWSLNTKWHKGIRL
jgi:hypothetical protein